MLTVLIRNADDPAALAATLATLVSGAVEGLVRDVVVLDAEAAEVRRVADHAGCRLASEGEVRANAQGLKGDWILLVEAGDRLSPGWIDAVVLHAGRSSSGPRSAGYLPTSMPSGWLARITAARRGTLLVPKAHLLRHAARDAALTGLRKGIRVRRLTVQGS